MAEYARADTIHSSLFHELENALPEGALLNINHISTPPTKCAAIYSAPNGNIPQKTYCESHFLTASIDIKKLGPEDPSSASDVLVYAIEVLIYSTATLTTLFVSKADSTGYLHELGLPRGTASPIQIISTTFLSYLSLHRRRPGIPFVLTLFARAQDQYLFPGSIENSGKHVLDDRGLIRWWCKVLDPVLRTWPAKVKGTSLDESDKKDGVTSQGYLIIPGYDRYETQAIFPPSFRSDATEQKRWQNGHPLEKISSHSSAPPRCLIPHFPDDPKARFLDELDEEISETSEHHTTQRAGQWKSIKSMDQFWETMQFRQECSSGRLVGFVWVVLMPGETDFQQIEHTKDNHSLSKESQNLQQPGNSLLPTPVNSQSQDLAIHPYIPVESQKSLGRSETTSPSSSPLPPLNSVRENSSHTPKAKKSNSSKPKRLTGPIRTRQPRFRSNTTIKKLASIPRQSQFYVWPSEGRGSVVLTEKDYKRINNLLLKLDFANLDVAQQSTRKWFEEIRLISNSKKGVGSMVQGRCKITTTLNNQESANVLLGRKRKNAATGTVVRTNNDDHDNINTLSAGLMRRKPKAEAPPAEEKHDIASSTVNTLGSSLIRKKAKA